MEGLYATSAVAQHARVHVGRRICQDDGLQVAFVPTGRAVGRKPAWPHICHLHRRRNEPAMLIKSHQLALVARLQGGPLEASSPPEAPRAASRLASCGVDSEHDEAVQRMHEVDGGASRFVAERHLDVAEWLRHGGAVSEHEASVGVEHDACAAKAQVVVLDVAGCDDHAHVQALDRAEGHKAQARRQRCFRISSPALPRPLLRRRLCVAVGRRHRCHSTGRLALSGSQRRRLLIDGVGGMAEQVARGPCPRSAVQCP
mmetsp:Transcript_124145/g.356610  ORF Transcript_124145/g.356610 Transcript_124145/m.356610 type:complete len:258 (-) Transcript_124145:1426-2199(-)